MRDRTALVFMLALAALTTEVVFHFGWLGDYPLDAGPAVDALAAGHPVAALRAQPLMGVVSILLRAPAVAAVRALGGGDVGAYRAGAVACLLPAAWLAVRLVTSFAAQPMQRSTRLVAAVLVVAGPATVAALQFGHPEEVLAASLVVAATVLAARSRGTAAGIALGLAVATKQWALVAIAPTIAAAPRAHRARLAGVAAATAALFFAPVVAVDPAGFMRMNHAAAGTHAVVTRSTIWFLAAAAHATQLHLPAGYPSAVTVYNVPAWVGIVAHPLLVLVPVPLVVLLGRARQRPAPLEWVGVLAVVCLLRCVLDPVDNLYYHVPLLLSLVAWEVVARVRLPIVSVLTAAALYATFQLVDPAAQPPVTNAFYLAWTATLGVYLLVSVVRGPRRTAEPAVHSPSAGHGVTRRSLDRGWSAARVLPMNWRRPYTQKEIYMLAKLQERRQALGNESGFTLIELLVVLIIIGILLAIAVPSYLGFKDRAEIKGSAANVRSAIPAAEAYYSDNNNYTGMTLSALQGVDAGISSTLVVFGSGQQFCLSDHQGTHFAKYVGPGGSVLTNLSGDCTSATG